MRRIFVALVVTLLALSGCSRPAPVAAVEHTVPTTVFWVGEAAAADNRYIPNSGSVWQDNWQEHFGGYDDPEHRSGYRPAEFAPGENPFYFALPYSDFADGERKRNVTRVPWYDPGRPPAPGTSVVKNHWIAVTYQGRTVYGQWEDAGPMGENDVEYIFGSAAPRYRQAGLDLSPAMANFLARPGEGHTSWRFVNETEVPTGPWRDTVTTSQTDWR